MKRQQSLQRTLCPHCGEGNYPQDTVCLGCGQHLNLAKKAAVGDGTADAQNLLPPSPARRAVPVRMILGAAVVVVVAAILFFRLDPLTRSFLALLGILPLFAGMYHLNEYLKERAFEKRMERMGGDKAAIAAELARIPKHEGRIIQTGSGPVKIGPYDPRLNSSERVEKE